jgi:hypothetical protein
MFRLTSHARSRRLTIVSALVAVLALVGCTPATASDVRVRHALFGMHDGTVGTASLGQIHEGAVRLWDVGVQWNQVETSRHHYTWSRLDQLVASARAAHAEVTMVVAGTPSFYSKDPWNVPDTHVGDYKAFVAHLMKRYGRRIAAYQVWNEGNIKTFWTGTPAKLARLTQAMDRVRDKVDRHVKVIAPPMVTRLKFEMEGLSKYYSQRVGGRPVWRYVDAVALSLYPEARYGGRTGVPEDSMKLLHAARTRLHRAGVPGSLPVWNTEINYGLGSGAATKISAARQASNVMRTYLLNAANGVKRVFWYRYDWGFVAGTDGTLGNTVMTSPTDSTAVTAGGRAFQRAQRWMHGTLLGTRHGKPCQKDRNGTYTCVVKDSSGKRWIYWNPFHGARVTLPRGVHHSESVLGATGTVKPRSTIKVTFAPVMIH